MKQNINRLIIFVVALMACASTVSAQAWVDKLINRYKNSDGVEKQISIIRDPSSRKAVREDYLFSFSAAKEYSYVKNELVKHADDADYFHMTDEKSPRVTFRQSSGDQRTTIDIVKTGKTYRLTVNRMDEAQAQAAEIQRQAQLQAQEEARRAHRQAQEEARQAQRQAQEQARQAQEQARQAQRQAQEQARQAQEQARQAHRQAQEQARRAQKQAQEQARQAQRYQSTAQTQTKVVRADSAANTAAIAAQRELLRKAKARRQK